jgi:hypothetical protein
LGRSENDIGRERKRGHGARPGGSSLRRQPGGLVEGKKEKAPERGGRRRRWMVGGGFDGDGRNGVGVPAPGGVNAACVVSCGLVGFGRKCERIDHTLGLFYLYINYNLNYKWEITTLRTLHDLEDQEV